MSTKTALQDGQIMLPNCRLSYPKLYKAEPIKNDPTSKPRYGCQFLLPKSDEATKAKIDKEIDRLSKLHFKGVKPKSKDIALKDGDGEDGDENTAGHWIISANRSESQGRPQVVGRDRKPIDSSEQSTVYGGCYVNGLVAAFVPKKWGKICFSLEIVQKTKDGESFGAPRVEAEDVMPELADEDGDEFE